MAKVLKTAALVIGAVALVATGVGAAAGLALGTSIAGGIGAASAMLTSAIGIGIGGLAAISAGLSVAAGLLAKKPTGVNGGSQTEFRADPNAGVPYAMGRTATSGNIVMRRATDGFASNSKNDLNDFLTVLSGGGPIQGYVSFTSDKEAVTFDGGGNALGKYRDIMFQDRQLGACPEPAALQVTAGYSSWPTGMTSAHKLSGMAATLWRLRYDSKKDVFFQNGVPKPVWVIDGVRCYDPRKDSTYPGGSGPHRWNDESTWEWTENPYLHALTWCIGRHQNGKRVMGLGAPIDQIIVAQFVEGANIADANGWKIGGVIYSRPDSKWNNLKLILQAGAGQPIKIGARIGCMINTPRVSLATITPADIVGDAQLATMQPISSRLNTVIPRYRSPAHEWEIVPAEPIRVADYVMADGDERSREIEFTLVQDVSQAATLGRYEIEDSRELGPGSFPLKPAWLNYKAGDCVTLDLPDASSLKLLLLTRSIEAATGVVTFTVRSETDGKHPFALGQTGTPPPTASVGAFDPTVEPPPEGDWILNGTTLTANGASIPALVALGAVSNSLADAAIFDFRTVELELDGDGEPVVDGDGHYVVATDSEGEWTAAGVEPPTIVRKEITGVTPGTAYQVSVRYRVRGIIGGRRILPAVVSGEFGVSQQGVHTLRSRTVAYPVTSDDDSITVAAFSGVLDDGRTISFPAAEIAALSSGTTYGVFWDIAGASYHVEASPAATAMASNAYVFLNWSTTSDGGSYPEGPTPPPGWGGDGVRENMAYV